MRRNVFFAVLSFMVLTACNSNNDRANRVMDLAEYYLESRPDTALSILGELTDAESFTGRTQARFALLAVQALHKNYYPLESDSLIFLALSYYQDKNEIVPKGKAHLYYANYLFEQELYEEALEHYEQSIRILEDTDEAPKYLGMAYEGVGRVNIETRTVLDVREHLKKSLECFLKANDSTSICNANLNIGFNYLRRENFDSAFYYLNRTQEISELIDYPEKAKLFYNWGLYYRAIEDYEKSEINYLKAIELDKDNERYHNSLANMYWRNNDFEKAKNYLSLQNDDYGIRAETQYILFDMAKIEGKYKEALDALEASYNFGDEYFEKFNARQQEHIKLSKDFLQARFDKVNLKNENHKMILIIVILTIVLFGTIIGLHFFYKYRNHKRQMREVQESYNANLKEIGRYSGLLAHYELQNDQLKKKNQKEIDDLRSRIDLLTEQNQTLSLRLKNQGKMETMEQNSDEVDQLITGFIVYYNLIKISPRFKIETQDELYFIQFLNFMMNDFVERLKKETDIKLTNHELQVACLIRLGYSNERIGKFFNSKSESISRAKNRMKTRLNIPADVSLDNFLRLF